MIVGGLLAFVIGTSLGSYLKAGELFYERPAPQVIVEPEAAPTPIFYMTDASGKIPEYVIGTDSRPLEPLPVERVAWEPPALVELADLTDSWSAPAPEPSPPVTYAPPPSVSGDILSVAVSTPSADANAYADLARPAG